MTAEQDAKASIMDSQKDIAATNTVSDEVQQKQLVPTSADMDEVQAAPYTLPLDPQAEQLLPNEIMAHIYSFCERSTLLNCLTASQVHFDLTAPEMYRHMDTRVRAKRVAKRDPWWCFHFLFSEDRNTRTSAAQRLRDQLYRSAITGLRDEMDFFIDENDFPDIGFLSRYLPNTNSYAWNSRFWVNFEIRREKSGNWNHLSLEVESPAEFLEYAGGSYTENLIANMKMPLASLQLQQGMVDPDDFSEEEEGCAIENQREWAELISEVSTFCDGLKILKISTSSRAPESDVHLLHRLMSPSLLDLSLSTMNGAELEMILSWDVPQLRRIEVTLETQTDWKIASPQNITGFRPGCVHLEEIRIEVESPQSRIGTSTFDFVMWLCALLPIQCKVSVRKERWYGYKMAKDPWMEEAVIWYRKIRQIEQQSRSL